MIETEAQLRKTYWNTLIHSVITFMGQSLMQIVDLFFCRNLGSRSSATVGTASTLFAWFMIVGLGLVLSLEYWVPHSIGEKDETKATSFFYSGILVAFCVSTFSAVGLWLLSQHLAFLGMNAEIQPSVTSFAHIIALSYFPVFLIPTLRVELQARGHPHDTTYAFLFGNILNVFLNWALIHGHCGFPELGLVGCAWANLLSRFSILAYLITRVKKVRSKLSFNPIHWKEVSYVFFVKKIVHMGLPTCFHMLFEAGAFILVGTFAAQMDPAQTAAHMITITIASFMFMIPLGLGSAGALTLSKLNGEKRRELAVHYGKFTIHLGLLYAVAGSTLLLLARKSIFSIYSTDPDTLRIGMSLMLIAAFFQIADASQVILAGVLRGFGQTKVQAVMNGIGHWLIGLPIGFYLAFHLNWGIRGFWVGLSLGLFAAAIGLYYFWIKATHTQSPITVSEVQI